MYVILRKPSLFHAGLDWRRLGRAGTGRPPLPPTGGFREDI